jgi:hypothetical protein
MSHHHLCQASRDHGPNLYIGDNAGTGSLWCDGDESDVHSFTVEIHGTPAAFEAAFPPVPSSAEDDQGMTSHEVCADWIEKDLAPRFRFANMQVVVRP